MSVRQGVAGAQSGPMQPSSDPESSAQNNPSSQSGECRIMQAWSGAVKSGFPLGNLIWRYPSGMGKLAKKAMDLGKVPELPGISREAPSFWIGSFSPQPLICPMT